MRKNILRILSFTLTAMVMITSVPMTGFASQPIKNDVANSEGSNNVTDSESVSSNETNITDSDSVSSNETNITDSDSVSLNETNITDGESVSMNETNVVQSLLDASYVIEGGDYTYEDGMENDSDFKELFTAVYNDKCFEERGGRFYTGEQIVSLTGKKGANVKAIKKSTGNEVSLQEVTDSAEFAVTGIPAEFSDAYSWRHNSDGRYNYTDNNLFLDTADDLKNRKLFAWEYEKGSDGIYRRVSVQEIKQYSLDGYIEEQTTVSGKVVVDISKLKNKTNPIAIIAFMYDAGKDSDWNSLENRFHYDDDYQDAEDGQWKYYSRVFATVKYIEKESKRYALYFGDGYEGNGVKKYYNDEIYSKDLMGTFSMAPYIYLRDDEKNTVTIFGISPAKDDSEYSSIQGRISLGNYKEFRYADDLSDYVMDDWRIPAKWTDQTTSKTYDVRLATAQYGTKYPSMTGTLTVEEGVGFPEDCSDLFHLNGPMEGIVIGGKTGTVGSNITNMSGMFWGNEINNNTEKPGNLLGRLDIKAFDTSNVTNMNRMFYGQRLGEPLDVSTLNTSKVTDFSYMFYQLYAGNPDVSNFDTSSAVDMSYMFGGVGYSGSKVSHNAPAVAHGTFTELNVSGFDFSKVKSMRGMFSNNAGLTKIVLPKEPKTGGVEDMSELFMSCSSLSDGSIENLEKLDTSGCTDMAVMFGCDAHTKLIETRMNDKGEVIRETEHKFGNSLSRGPAFTKLDLSNFNTSKVKDMSGMFDLPNCKTIIFGDGFDVSGVELMQGMFTLNIMDELDISSFNTASLMNASAMFNMPTVRKLTLGKFDLSYIESVYSSSRMFGCKTLDELDLSEAIFGSNKYALCSDSIAYNNEGSIESGSLSLKCIRLPANLPEFISKPDLPAVFKDEEGNEYIKIAGKNEKQLVLRSEEAGPGPDPSPSPSPSPDADDSNVAEIVLSLNQASVYPKGTVKLSAVINPANAKDKSVRWASSDETFAKVDENGLVTALKSGTDEKTGLGIPASVEITAISNADENVKAVCVVTILPSEVVEKDDKEEQINPDIAYNGDKANIWVAGLNENAEYFYTGNAIKPEINVYKGYKLLAEQTDYTITYKNNKNVSKAVSDPKKKPQIMIRLKGNYSGSETVYFDIVPMPLDKLTAENDSLTAQYKAKKKNQIKPTLMYNGSPIKYGSKDITFVWTDENGKESECIDPGTYTVKLKAGTSGNYTGSNEDIAKVYVKESDTVLMSKVKVNGFKTSLPYAKGNTVTQNVTISYKDKSGTHDLKEGADYTVTYENNIDIGTATVTFEAIKDAGGNYVGKCSGKLVKNFKITGKYVLTEGAELSVIPESESYEYTGNAIKPNVKVVARIKRNDGSVETKTLRAGVDYALSYKNNKDVAAVNAVKNGKDIAPQIIIKGKGSYALGSDKNVGITKKFSIDKAKVENLFITAGDVTYNKKANAYQKTKISFADNGNISRKLAVNKDYKISFKTVGDTQVPAVGQTVKAKIEGIGPNYIGVASVSYRIIDPKKDTDISKAKAIINADAKGKTQPCIYTGKAIEPGMTGQPTLKITVGSGKNLKTLTEGKDFEIVGYLNNIEKGSKAVVIIRGIGECKGIKSFNFKINQSDVKNVWGGVYEKKSLKIL